MKPSLRKLFLTNLYLSAFTFGGGYVIITLMKKSSWTVSTGLMNRKCWIWWPSPSPVPAPLPSMEPLWWISDGGNPGTLISVLATVLPPFVILSLISLCYTAFRSNDYVGWMLNRHAVRRSRRHRSGGSGNDRRTGPGTAGGSPSWCSAPPSWQATCWR